MIKNPIAHVEQGWLMKLLGFRQPSLLLIVTLLFCHGVFGSLHLLCYSPQCAGDAEHATEHRAEAGGAHDHPAGHVVSTEYFAVLAVGFLGLLFGLLPKVAPQTRRASACDPSPGACRNASPTYPHTTHPSGVQALRTSFAPVTREQGT